MARTGITKTQVRAIRERLLADGRYPSADAVRGALGDTGSKSTIHRYLKELAAEVETAAGTGDAEDGLRELVEQLARKVYAETARRLEAMRAAHEQALRDKDAELAALRNTVAALSARLRLQDGVTPAGVPHEPGAAEPAGAIAGFGQFGDLLANSRSGRQDMSLFNLVRAGGRDNVLDFPGERAA
jgi:Plasmid replication region DNA-binding N-term